MKWDKKRAPDGLLCKAAAGKGRAAPITAYRRSRTAPGREAEHPCVVSGSLRVRGLLAGDRALDPTQLQAQSPPWMQSPSTDLIPASDLTPSHPPHQWLPPRCVWGCRADPSPGLSLRTALQLLLPTFTLLWSWRWGQGWGQQVLALPLPLVAREPQAEAAGWCPGGTRPLLCPL